MCLKYSSFNGWLKYIYTIYTVSTVLYSVFSYYGFKHTCLYVYRINLHFLLFVSKEEKEQISRQVKVTESRQRSRQTKKQVKVTRQRRQTQTKIKKPQSRKGQEKMEGKRSRGTANGPRHRKGKSITKPLHDLDDYSKHIIFSNCDIFWKMTFLQVNKDLNWHISGCAYFYTCIKWRAFSRGSFPTLNIKRIYMFFIFSY